MNKYDRIVEVNKNFDVIHEIKKFNPYHDRLGRFTTAGTATSFTYKPGQGKMYDLAIEREKKRTAAQNGVKEAESRIASRLKDGAVVKLDGVDPAMVGGIEKAIGDVLDRYPSTKDAFSGFTTDEPSAGYFSEGSVMACYAPSTGVIHLNTKYYGNRSEFNAVYEKSVERKHSPEGTTLDSVVTHEMGHAIDYYVSSKVIDGLMFHWGGERVSSRMWNNDIKNGKKKGTPMTGASIKEGLSSYAGKNHKEYLAEGFAEFMTSPNPRPMAQSIGKRLQTYIKKAEKASD